MKKVTTLSRWAKYRELVSNQLAEDTVYDDLNERMEEILSSAVALQTMSDGLIKLATLLGNADADEDFLREFNSIYPVSDAFTDLMSNLLADEFSERTKVKTKLRKKMPIFTMKGETV